MPTYSVVDMPYVGSLLAVNLFSGSTTMLLNFFGSSVSTSMVDDGTQLYVGEELLLGGGSYEFLGSGTAQPGINVLGLTVPTGFPKDLILLRNVNTGTLHFVFPDGVPNALGMIALVVTLQPVGYDMATNGPLCFAEGTLIETTTGQVPVEDLPPGSMLVSPNGPPLRLVANICAATQWVSPSALLPVVIAKDAFGPECPNQCLMVSQQHGIALGGRLLELIFGLEAALAPALGLVNFGCVTIGHGQSALRYRHLVCDRHAVVMANGVMAETLLWTGANPEKVSFTEAEAEAAAPLQPQTCCLPRLSVRETRLLIRKAKGDPAKIGAFAALGV